MRIIIAIDILDGKCVRLTRGDFGTKKIYNEDPIEVAKEIADNGLKYLHLVDLDGARNKKIINYRILEQISLKTGLSIDFGGGIRSDDDIRIAFASGAKQVTAGSIAVKAPDLFLEWLTRYGNEKIILGADCKNRKVTTGGWTEDTDEDVTDFISRYHAQGVKYTICTDVERDGMLTGPSTGLYKEILGAVKIKLIASGGIATLNDLDAVRVTGCEGVIIGKAIYEGKIKLKQLRDIC